MPIRTLYFYTVAKQQPVSSEWGGMRRVLADKADKVIDQLESNEVHVIDVDKFFSFPESTNSDLSKRHEENFIEIAKSTTEYITSQKKFDIIISGQTDGTARIVTAINNQVPVEKRPFLIVRFSGFYGGKEHACYKPGRPPKEVGYNLDCPKDFSILYGFLTDQAIIQGIANESVDEVIIAIDDFNQKNSGPNILIF